MGYLYQEVDLEKGGSIRKSTIGCCDLKELVDTSGKAFATPIEHLERLSQLQSNSSSNRGRVN